ncbi:MAG: flagellar motor switch phosphatase FliY [Firmicutes bacterium]|nr:flagellar motor switch phosphatase FliY [Bacillota bacterium]
MVNKDFLSEDELSALVGGGPGRDLDPDEFLSMFDRDALGEIGNISFGTAATTLSTLLHHKVNITTPQVTLLRSADFGNDFPAPHVAAHVEYISGLAGSNILAIKLNDAQIIADLMLGGDGSAPAEELNELHLSAVAEAMNQMMGTASTSMSTLLKIPVNISPPSVKVIDAEASPADLFKPAGDILVKISFRLHVGNLIDSHIMQMLSLDFANNLLEMLMGAGDITSQDAKPQASSGPASTHTHDQGKASMATEDPYGFSRSNARNAYSSGASSFPESGTNVDRGGNSGVSQAQPPAPTVERVAFASFGETPTTRGGRNLDLLLDVPLGLTVELGRTKKLIRDILDFSTGSIIELDTLAGEPVDILINNKLIARGEVVVIDESFGVRVTDILSPAERIKRLQ